MDLLEQVQKRASKMMMRGWTKNSYVKLGLFRLEKRRLWRDDIASSNILQGTYEKARGGLFTRACRGRTRGKRLLTETE